jgi:DnaJ-class molecular chaperone
MLIDVDIDPISALIGYEFELKHPDGKTLSIKTNKSVEHQAIHTIKGKGLPISPDSYGDLQLRFLYNKPKDLSEEEINLLSQYVDSRKKRGIL